MTSLVLLPIAIALMIVGAVLVWPVARRVGERHPDQLYWVPVHSPQSAGRRWVAVEPRPARVSLRTRLAGRWSEWWASTAPRDVHAPVRAALAGRSRILLTDGRGAI